jgi:hypothetical protein
MNFLGSPFTSYTATSQQQLIHTSFFFKNPENRVSFSFWLNGDDYDEANPLAVIHHKSILYARRNVLVLTSSQRKE